jgi:hypothetical protein
MSSNFKDKFVKSTSDPTYVNVTGDTMTGPLVLYGNPTQALEAANKAYVDTLIANLSVSGPQGEQGVQGAQGPQGEQGLRGATWYVNGGPPSLTTGLEGDLYLNTVTSEVFQKINGVWAVIAGLQGKQGQQGPKGDPGPDMLSEKTDTGDFNILFDDEGTPLTEITQL